MLIVLAGKATFTLSHPRRKMVENSRNATDCLCMCTHSCPRIYYLRRHLRKYLSTSMQMRAHPQLSSAVSVLCTLVSAGCCLINKRRGKKTLACLIKIHANSSSHLTNRSCGRTVFPCLPQFESQCSPHSERRHL